MQGKSLNFEIDIFARPWKVKKVQYRGLYVDWIFLPSYRTTKPPKMQGTDLGEHTNRASQCMVWSSTQANTEMPHVQRKFWMNGKDVVYLLDTPVAIDEECNP